MANQFIHQSNQNLLWKIINNTPQMISFFGGAAPGEKERWFQQVIGHVYNDSIAHPSNMSLRDLNTRAIDLMVDLLKQAQAQAQAQAHSQTQVQESHDRERMQSTQIINKPGVSNTSSMESQFEMRRKEYENMTKKTVPTPSFNENIKDEAISDIGSAVNEYMKQRELDSKMFAPKEPPTKGADNQGLQRSDSGEALLDVEEIDNNFSAKKVKWGKNTEHIYKESDQTSITQVLEMVSALSKKIDAQSTLIQSLIEKLENNEKNIENN